MNRRTTTTAAARRASYDTSSATFAGSLPSGQQEEVTTELGKCATAESAPVAKPAATTRELASVGRDEHDVSGREVLGGRAMGSFSMHAETNNRDHPLRRGTPAPLRSITCSKLTLPSQRGRDLIGELGDAGPHDGPKTKGGRRDGFWTIERDSWRKELGKSTAGLVPSCL